jgi:hypothetical protein
VPVFDEADQGGTPVERLERAAKELEQAARQAAANGDIGRVIQAQRAITDTIGLQERLRPAPAVPPDDRPDMQAAAVRARKALHDFFDRLSTERDE